MSQFLGHCVLPVASRRPVAPFQLLRDQALGSRPLQLKPHRVYGWSRNPTYYAQDMPFAVQMEQEGLQRLRLYCADRPASAIRVLVDGGRLGQLLGRRQDTVVETLTWVHSQSQFLRYPYDQPDVTIRASTAFYDRHGQAVAPPVYRAAQGLFHHAKAVTGALVVAYRPAYFLYEIHYDTGADMLSEQALRAIKLAWLMGNIEDAVLPEVRVIALSGQQATQLAFRRAFWPRASSAAAQFIPVEQLTELGNEEMVYLETAREVSRERIYSSQYPNNFIDILKTHSVTFSPQPGAGQGRTSAGQSGKMMMRFANQGSSG
jgi:hypothetical protein